MDEERFSLTVRAKDIEEIYFKSDSYKEITEKLFDNLKHCILYLSIAIVLFISILNNYNAHILLALVLIGLLFNLVKGIIHYRKIKNLEKILSDWIGSFINFKHHTLFINDDEIKYMRDDEVFIYKYKDFNSQESWIEPTYRYVKIKTTDDELFLPAKSFQKDEYDIFIRIIKELNVLQ